MDVSLVMVNVLSKLCSLYVLWTLIQTIYWELQSFDKVWYKLPIGCRSFRAQDKLSKILAVSFAYKYRVIQVYFRIYEVVEWCKLAFMSFYFILTFNSDINQTVQVLAFIFCSISVSQAIKGNTVQGFKLKLCFAHTFGWPNSQ